MDAVLAKPLLRAELLQVLREACLHDPLPPA
jgi:hypothetical protein